MKKKNNNQKVQYGTNPNQNKIADELKKNTEKYRDKHTSKRQEDGGDEEGWCRCCCLRERKLKVKGRGSLIIQFCNEGDEEEDEEKRKLVFWGLVTVKGRNRKQKHTLSLQPIIILTINFEIFK